jgi:hypothetical protein
MGRPARETQIIDGARHWRCRGPCGQMLPRASFTFTGQYPIALCRTCNRARGKMYRMGQRAPSGNYLETLERFQAWAAKRERSWKAEVVVALTERMNAEVEGHD